MGIFFLTKNIWDFFKGFQASSTSPPTISSPIFITPTSLISDLTVASHVYHLRSHHSSLSRVYLILHFLLPFAVSVDLYLSISIHLSPFVATVCRPSPQAVARPCRLSPELLIFFPCLLTIHLGICSYSHDGLEINLLCLNALFLYWCWVFLQIRDEASRRSGKCRTKRDRRLPLICTKHRLFSSTICILKVIINFLLLFIDWLM